MTVNEIYTFGHSAKGRSCDKKKRFQPFPFQVRFLTSQVVKLVACGSEHALATTTSTMFSWGSGDGGKLGHGDS